MIAPVDPEAARERVGAGPTDRRPAAALLYDLAAEIGTLLRLELALLKAELGQNLKRAGRGAIVLAAGAVLVFSGWAALVAAAILALSLLVPPWLAALVVALANLLAGAGLLYFGRRRLAVRSLIPKRALRSLGPDPVAIGGRDR